MPTNPLPHDGALLSRFVEATTAEARAEAFEELVLRHGALVLNVCRRILLNEHDAQDAAQATFITLALKARGLTNVAVLPAWLHHVARCIAADLRASNMRRLQREKAAEDMRQHQTGDSDELERLRELLDQELDAMPEKYRLPVIVHHLQGKTITESAAALRLNVGTFSTRLARGMNRLRERLAAHRATANVTASAILSSAAVGSIAIPPLFAGHTAHAAALAHSGNVAAASASTLLAKAAIKTMLYAQIKATAAAVVVTAILTTSAAVAFAKLEQKPRNLGTAASMPAPARGGGDIAAAPAAEDKPALKPDNKTQPQPSIMISPRFASAERVFNELEDKGIKVLLLGERDRISPEPPNIPYSLTRRKVPHTLRSQILWVPEELRFKPMDGKELVDAIAAAQELKVAWIRDGKVAVLYMPASNMEMERVTREFESAELSVRREASRRTASVHDIRVVPLLLKAARDPDAEVARKALIRLRSLDWGVVLALDDSAASLIAADLDSKSITVSRQAIFHVAEAGGKQAFALLEKALSSQDENLRTFASRALKKINGGRALELIEKALADSSDRVRLCAVEALGRVGGAKASALLTKSLADPSVIVRWSAALALASAEGAEGTEKVLMLLDKALDDPDNDVRQYAACGLANLNGKKALPLLEKAIADKDTQVRSDAIHALGLMDIDEDSAMALLEKTLEDPRSNVRYNAALMLGYLGGEKARVLLEKALASNDLQVSRIAAEGLGMIGGDKAFAALETALASPVAAMRFHAAFGLGGYAGSEKARLLLEKALEDPDFDVRFFASDALGRIGSLESLEKALVSQDASVRGTAARALGGYVASEQAATLLEKAMTDKDHFVRYSAAYSLGRVGGANVHMILEKALADPEPKARQGAAVGLGVLGSDKACASLLAAVKIEKDYIAWLTIERALKNHFADVPGVLDMLEKLPRLPAPKNQPSQKAVKPPTAPPDDVF